MEHHLSKSPVEATASKLTDSGTGDALGSGSLLTDMADIEANDTFELNTATDGSGTTHGGTFAVTATSTVQDLVDHINAVDGVRAEFDEKSGDLSITSNDDIFLYADLDEAGGGAEASVATISAADLTANAELTGSGSFKAGDTLELTDGNGYELGSFEVEKGSTVKDLQEFLNDKNGVSASYNEGTGKMTIESDVSVSLKSDNGDFNASSFTADSDGVNVTAALESGFATDNDINRVTDRLNRALSNLRAQASEFGTNLSTVEIRQEYTKSMINTLQEGAGKLTLADTNEEGANLLALQTRQQLASTSLSFASQADQTVLSLF